MERKRRFTISGIPQHIVQRGHSREPCFYSDSDYYCYLDSIKLSTKRNHCVIHAYCLMTNHVHLLVTPMTSYGVSHFMQDIGRKYVRYVNHTYRRSGTLWEGRFQAGLVDSEAYLLTCMRYIELNPVRAAMVEHPGDYKWSSYHVNAYGQDNSIIQPHPMYFALGENGERQEQTYRELFRHHIDTGQLHSIREALNQELVLGRDDFKQKINEITQRQVIPGTPGRPRVEDEVNSYMAYVF